MVCTEGEYMVKQKRKRKEKDQTQPQEEVSLESFCGIESMRAGYQCPKSSVGFAVESL